VDRVVVVLHMHVRARAREERARAEKTENQAITTRFWVDSGCRWGSRTLCGSQSPFHNSLMGGDLE
jgi:hypothetical protein